MSKFCAPLAHFFGPLMGDVQILCAIAHFFLGLYGVLSKFCAQLRTFLGLFANSHTIFKKLCNNSLICRLGGTQTEPNIESWVLSYYFLEMVSAFQQLGFQEGRRDFFEGSDRDITEVRNEES